ncbi:hypothetical protein PR202_gb25619 [Eleusine coracana subsp. coracana]|uniref:Peptidase M24 domain-containing protein n=1 Tax=Eleusine coracana subsp. coracana TaxID=191504 RepID=A0AAV5FLZ5_ELECO|nr:hypothetical protein PR202_gb25619 [Eleusine coracana subsp. coracana]
MASVRAAVLAPHPSPAFTAFPCRRSASQVTPPLFRSLSASQQERRSGDRTKPTIGLVAGAQRNNLSHVKRSISCLRSAVLQMKAAVVHGSEGAKGREPLRRGTISPRLMVPDHIPRPPYVGTESLPEVCPDRQMHDSESIGHMRAACKLAARVLQYAGTLVKPSVTTDEIDRAVHQMIIDAGAYPSPLGYGGFPKSVTEECMMRCISACKHGASFKEIGQRISEVAGKYGYSIDPFVGHGVGRIFHSEPIIWHTYDYEPGFMVAGQTFTIEPTLSMGSTQCVLWDDGWTAVAVDGSLSAQFEHTVLITADCAEILTKYCP